MSIDVEVGKLVRQILKDDGYKTEFQIREIVATFYEQFDHELKSQTEMLEKLRESHDRLWDIMNAPKIIKRSRLHDFFENLKFWKRIEMAKPKQKSKQT